MLLIEKIIQEAVYRDASDIHFIKDIKPILRIKGNLNILENFDVLTEDALYGIYDYIIKGNVQKNDEYMQKRRLDTSIEIQNIRLRVNCSFSSGVPTFTLRIIENNLPSFEELEIPEIARSMISQTQGLILITGKSNSGKTTTLNSLINEINKNQNKKILTLENPIEYKHQSQKSIIVQKEVGIGKDVVSYSEGVKNALREDCDILIIGEIRDRETMDSAIEMVESGHLVIGTLHTNSCVQTIERIIGFYDIRDQIHIKNLISHLLKLVISQRLLKVVSKDEFVLIPEVMVVDDIISAFIRKEKLNYSEIEDYMQANSNSGNIKFVSSLLKAYSNGKITLDQVKTQIEEKDYEFFNKINGGNNN